MLWNISYKNDRNVLSQLYKKYCERRFKCQKTKQSRLILVPLVRKKSQGSFKIKISINQYSGILITFEMASLK